jgi:hypothetical protein
LFVRIWRFATLMLTALSAGMALCHLMEMPARRNYAPALWSRVTNIEGTYRLFGPPVGASIEGGALTAADLLRTLGAEPPVADALDPNALLGAVDSLKTDAVAHKLSSLKRPPMRHSGTAATDALRYAGKENVSRASFLAFANGICSAASGPTADVVFGAGRVATNES